MTGEAGWNPRPADLRRQVRRLWDRGLILASLATGETLFPKRLVLRRPGSTELRDRFDEVRAWVAALRSMPHVRLSMREVRHRVSGTNLLPHEAWVDTFEDAVALIRKQPELDEFRPTRGLDPRSTARPARLGGEAARFGPCSSPATGAGCSTSLAGSRTIRAPVSTSARSTFRGCTASSVEAHRGVLGELLDRALPPTSIDAGAPAGVAGFARRYGFREKPERIRFPHAGSGPFPAAGGR